MTEVWKPIPAYPAYEVSDPGRVRSYYKLGQQGRLANAPQRILAARVDHEGYSRLNLSANGSTITCRMHQLVATIFLGPCPESLQINHRDGDKQNNRANNLEYITPSENMSHAFATGLRKPRTGPRAKLTVGAVTEIRTRYASGSSTGRQLAKEFGVNPTHISNIVHRRYWKHI